METIFTTVRTHEGQFIVIKSDEKYFLKYLKNGSHHSEVVGYLLKENGAGYNGNYYLQEAFFDKRNWPHTTLREVLSEHDEHINKDLYDNLFAACYQIEKTIWCKDNNKRRLINKSQGWPELINKLQRGLDLEKAVRSL